MENNPLFKSDFFKALGRSIVKAVDSLIAKFGKAVVALFFPFLIALVAIIVSCDPPTPPGPTQSVAASDTSQPTTKESGASNESNQPTTKPTGSSSESSQPSPKPTGSSTEASQPSPKPSLSPHSFAVTLRYGANVKASVLVSSVGFGANPSSAQYSTSGAAWNCVDVDCSLEKTLNAAGAQSAAWVKVTCKQNQNGSAADTCKALYLQQGSKWTMTEGPTADVKYFKTTSISGTVVEPLVIDIMP